MICTSIASLTYDEIVEFMGHCQMVELRLDSLDLNEAQLETLIGQATIPVLATCRPTPARSEEERIALLCRTVDWGAKWVDIEIESPASSKQVLRDATAGRAELVISYHDYTRTPVRYELETIVQRCFDEGADVAKIACTVNSHKDAARIMGIYSHFTSLVAIGMGDLGRITRVAAPLLGAPFTFASTDVLHKTAPGQLTTAELKDLYAIMEKA